METERKL